MRKCALCCGNAYLQGERILAEVIASNMIYLESCCLINIGGKLERVCEGCFKSFFNGYEQDEIRQAHYSVCRSCEEVYDVIMEYVG